MDILNRLKEELKVERWQVEAAVKLIDEGNTIPFIARYRKEVTGSLNDEALRNLQERLTYLRNLEEKKESVLNSIEEQGMLTDELREKILAADTQVVVEDLYRPYRPRRRTRASVAKEKGLQGLADFILQQETNRPLSEEAQRYVDEEKGVADGTQALQGALDIIAEAVSDDADYRIFIRNLTETEGKIVSSARDEKASSVYEMYYAYEEPVKKAAGHRILALNRGEAEKFLTVKIEAPEERILQYLEKKVITRKNPITAPVLKEALADSYHRLIAPAIEREIRNELTEKAEEGAIGVFGKNLQQLLMQPPIAGRVVLGWDPAFRTGCKLAVVDPTGKVLATKVIYPTAPQNRVEEAKRELKKLIDTYGVSLISLGNGTASRESEQIIVDLIKELKKPLQYVIVSEAGASVYSASKLATEECPNFDVGQYQHDMNQKKLGEALTGVVEDCVNRVGVDLNTASASLLEYISGVSRTVAKNIVEYREENGRFTDRKQLLKVPKLGPKAFEQCAGFLRIADGDNPLDATSVHPESYAATERLLRKLDMTMEDVRRLQKEAKKQSAGQVAARSESGKNRKGREDRREKQIVIRNTNTAMGKALAAAMGQMEQEGAKREEKRAASAQIPSERGETAAAVLEKKIRNKRELAAELGIGEITLADILKELEKPGRDPRLDCPAPILRSDVLDIKDLKPGMILKGTVRNVIDFGAFVDIGVHQDGLVHISQITDRFIRHPLEAVSVGDVVDVRVLDVDPVKKRIGLTMRLDQEEKPGGQSRK